MRIGIFGGTFDPVHVGHIVVATTVHHALQLDETRVIVAADPWQKDPPPIAPAAERYAAVQAAIYDIDDPSIHWPPSMAAESRLRRPISMAISSPR